MAPALRRIYDQMPEPKWVISAGRVRIASGSVFDNYAIVQNVPLKSLPVDVYDAVSPRRNADSRGMMLRRKKGDERIGRDRREHTKRIAPSWFGIPDNENRAAAKITKSSYTVASQHDVENHRNLSGGEFKIAHAF